MSDPRYPGYGRPEYPDYEAEPEYRQPGQRSQPGYRPAGAPPAPQPQYPPGPAHRPPYGAPQQRQPTQRPQPGGYDQRGYPEQRTPQQGYGQQPYRGPEGFDGPGYRSPGYADPYRSASRPAASRPVDDFDEEPGPNSLATAGLVFGILGNACLLGWIFSAIGLARARRLGGAGRGKAITGLILSTVWVVAGSVFAYPKFADTAKTIEKRTDAGCVAFQAFTTSPLGKKDLSKDDAKTMQADLTGYVTSLHNAAAKSTDADTKAAIDKLASDFQALLNAVKAGKQPAATLEKTLTDDAAAVDTACGNS